MDSMISTAGDDRTISGSLRFRERKLSAAQLSEGGMESIMSEDALAANSFPNNDPALTVRREFNFGASRLPVLLSESRHELSEERATGEAQNDSSTQETDEEQREVRESIFPCSCAFHYKSTIVDQLVLLPLSSMTERLLFTPKNSLTCAPFAFIQVLKQLGAKGKIKMNLVFVSLLCRGFIFTVESLPGPMGTESLELSITGYKVVIE